VDLDKYLQPLFEKITKCSSITDLTMMITLEKSHVTEFESQIVDFIRSNFSKQIEITVGYVDNGASCYRVYCTYMYCN